jgi:hypothetical protein
MVTESKITILDKISNNLYVGGSAVAFCFAGPPMNPPKQRARRN